MMASENTGGRTSEIEMIASRVVQNQANVCAVKMANITEKLDGLTESMGTMQGDLSTIKTEVAVLKTRLTVVAAISSSLPVIVVLVWEFLTH